MNRRMVSGKINRIGIVLFLISIFFNTYLFADSTYTIKKGDTLYSIGRRYSLTVAEICAANNLSDHSIIKVGQKIVIPDADISNAAALSATSKRVVTNIKKIKTKSYKVRKGDTFYGIARKYHIKLSELFSLNGLGSDSMLKSGQTLRVPDNDVKKVDIAKKNTVSVVHEKKSSSPNIKITDPRKYATAKAGDSLLDWPVKNPKVLYVKGKVSGVQLSAVKNEKVTSVRSGTVVCTGVYRGFGNFVFVESKTGLIYSYSGLGSITVKKGDYVVFGDKIGTAGYDSLTGKSQMTFMVFKNSQPIDPAKAPRD